MIDAILYVPSYSTLVAHLDANYPDMLVRDESGEIAQPPVVTGFARTPSVVNGDELLVYARFRQHEADQWRSMPGVQILGEAEYAGRGTADAVYGQVFADPDKRAIYDRVYPRPVTTIDNGDGTVSESQPPERFGVMAGA